MTHTEEQMKKSVVDRITSNSQVNVTDVRVQASDAHLTLRVTVPSSLARGIAVNDAMQVARIVAVDNQLEVEVPLPAVEDAPTDEHLGTQIREALSQCLKRYGSESITSAGGWKSEANSVNGSRETPTACFSAGGRVRGDRQD